ncbi:major facilitator superfamily domain-containing protein [Bisporella sp. PMI_857]|nr:major facilitator superfamily domain-containing protein [Bisporella sp. PMI_857]
MLDYQVMNPYSRPVSAMDNNAINRAEKATNRVASLLRDTDTISSPPGGRVRRKPVASKLSGSRRSRPSIRMYRVNSSEGEMGVSSWGKPEPAPVDIQTTEPHADYMGKGSNPRDSADQTEAHSLYPVYNYGEDIGDRNIGELYNSSSTTVNPTKANLPRPLTFKPTSLALQKPKSGSQDFALIGVICAAHFLTQAGLAQSIAPIPLIAKSFTTKNHIPSPSWYSAAYSLTVGTFILPSGRLGDIYGLKRLFIIGWLWFALSSLSAGFNPRILEIVDQQPSGSGETFFCFCRALQGIGPALLMPNGLGILGRTYEGNKKNMAFALFGASAPVGFVVGAVMSSLLAEKAHWGWAYWAQAIACMVMAAISVIIIPSFPVTAATTSQKDATAEDGGVEEEPMWKRLDLPGAILGVLALILINIALNQAPLVSWSTPYTYFLLIIGLVILSVFFFVEFTPFLAPHPLIPLSMLSVDTCFVLACIACGWGTFGIWIFYLWEFLETLRTLNPLLASAQFSPAALSGLLAAVTTGFLLSRTTPQVIMVLSMSAFFIGTTLIATTPVDQIYWVQAFFSIIVMPWGMDMSFPSATILLSSKVGHENQGVAMSLVNTVVNYSISVGLGLAGTVQDSVDENKTQILKGFRGAWYFGMGLSGVGIIVSVSFLALTAFTARGVRRLKEEVGEP